MNFGQNLYNWFLSNAQSLVLLAIVDWLFNYCDYCGWLSLQRCWSKRHFTRAIQSHYWCLNKTVLLWNISGFLMFRKGMVHQTKCGRDF